MSLAADTMEHDAMDPQVSHEDHLNSNGEIEPLAAQGVSRNADVLAAVVSHDSDRVNLDPALFEQAQTDGANGNGNIGNSEVKDEPMDDAGDIDWAFSGKEAINLCSDDEEDTTPQSTSRPPPRLRSPFAPQPRTTREDSGGDLMANGALNGTNGKSHEIAEPDASKANGEAEKAGPGARGISLGQSILQTKKPGVDMAELQAKKLQAQKDMAVRFREQQKAKAAAKGGHVPNGGNADESMRVTPVEQLDDVPEEPPPVQKPRGRGGRGKKPKDNAAITFGKLKSIYDRKKRAGTASIHDDIEFMKIESEEAARLRKLQADEDFDRTPSPEPEDDEGVFVSQDEAEIPSYRDLQSDDDDEDAGEGAKRSHKRKATADSDDETLKQNKARKRAGRPKGSSAAVKKAKKVLGADYTDQQLHEVLAISKRASDRKEKKAPAPKVKAKAPSKKKTGPTMTNVHSITSTDVFADTARVANLADQPGFEKTGRRPDALKQLIASVPTESKKIAQVDKKYLDDAIKSFTGYAAVRPAADGNWSVRGMSSSLKHYQILGVAFMRRRENDSNEPKGGILADQMGLGKTVMMLANIVNGKPKVTAKVKTTLIVAAPALVTQWFAEISKHCENFRTNKQAGIGKVIIYKAGNRMMSNADEEILSSHDIVLTTYHEIARSYPKAIIPTNLVTSTQKDAWWKTHYEKERGVLHRMKFLRIVLDEAQAIKNHKGHTSMACRAVDAKFHWAITGTPILNTVREFYPYFKFLREPNTGSYKIFKENFCSPDDPDGAEKLNVFLRKFMIRRTHIDTLFNARLLDLPQPKEHTLWLEFNEVERQIYEIVKKRFIQRINTIAKQRGGLEKQYNHIWTMILRLRQICGHILLVQGTIIDLLEREDFEKLNKITEAEDQMSDEGSSLLMHLRNVLRNNHGVKQIEAGLGNAAVFENETLPTGVIDVEEAEGKTGGKHGLSFRFRKYMESLVASEAWDVITQRTLCSGCRQPPQDPYVTSCFHIYCFSCLNDLQHFAARKGYDAARCGECGEAYNNVQKCENWETFSVRESTKGSSEAGDDAPASKKGPKPKKKKEDELPDWIGMAGEVLPSAKTMAVKAQVMEWLEEDNTAKIIIYSQFLPMIRILGKICQTEGWGYCKYTGTMSHDSRTKAIQEFGEKEDKVIMLASLRCGGLGLNLTMASRVIQLDPWWNAAVEQQAFCRVFRIGQQKETRMTRFVVKNTIDAAMMAMKERKQIEIDEVMDDKKRKEKLSVDDLMRLFGPVQEGSDGKPFIFAEGADQHDEGDPEHMRLPNVDSDDEEQMMGNEE